MAAALTDSDADGASRVGPLLDQVTVPLACTADGAYRRDEVCAAVVARHPGASATTPPRSGAVPSATAGAAPMQRDGHARSIAERGRRTGRQKAPGYGCKARMGADTALFRRMIGDALRSQADGRPATGVAIRVLNRAPELGRPEYARIA